MAHPSRGRTSGAVQHGHAVAARFINCCCAEHQQGCRALDVVRARSLLLSGWGAARVSKERTWMKLSHVPFCIS